MAEILGILLWDASKNIKYFANFGNYYGLNINSLFLKVLAFISIATRQFSFQAGTHQHINKQDESFKRGDI